MPQIVKARLKNPMKYDIHNYSSIYDFEGNVPSSHPRMSRFNRASQFAPFAALTGYEEAIKDKQKDKISKIDYSEEEEEMLNSKIIALLELKKNKPIVRISFYKKEETNYVFEKGRFIRYDEEKNLIVLSNGKKIPLLDITDIEFISEESND